MRLPVGIEGPGDEGCAAGQRDPAAETGGGHPLLLSACRLCHHDTWRSLPFEFDILEDKVSERAVGGVLDDGRSRHLSPYVAEGDVLEDAFTAMLVVDVAEVARLDVEVLEENAADVGTPAAIQPGTYGVHRRPSAADADVTEGGVADFAVAHAKADGVAAG